MLGCRRAAPGTGLRMQEDRKEARPGELEETIDLDLPQDPGIPGVEEHESATPASTPPPDERESEPDDAG